MKITFIEDEKWLIELQRVDHRKTEQLYFSTYSPSLTDSCQYLAQQIRQDSDFKLLRVVIIMNHIASSLKVVVVNSSFLYPYNVQHCIVTY